MNVSFSSPKQQPEHSLAELAKCRKVLPGVTSNIPLHLWDLRKIQATYPEEVMDLLLLEQDE